ncbi:MAG TPA: hypothetical protein PKD32_03070 [Saprospiraceae bacterium]|nr:hypothetical protein [Saprospiraceae bacterium]
MNNHRSYSFDTGRSFTEKLIGGLIFFIFLLVLFYLGFQIYKFLFYITPLFILIALILKPSVVWDHIKGIGRSFKISPLGGLFYLAMQLIGLPFVTAGLAFKAWAYRKFGQVSEKIYRGDEEQSYTPYEEVDLENIIIKKERVAKKESLKEANQYDDLFV